MNKRKKKAQKRNLSTNNGTEITNDNHLIKTDKPPSVGSLKSVEKQVSEGTCASTRSGELEQPIVLIKRLTE